MRPLLLLLALPVCYGQLSLSGNVSLNGNLSLHMTSSTPSLNLVFSPSNSGTPIPIGGDPYASNLNLAGYADPSMRYDGTREWLAYSWPNSVSGTSAISTHVAYGSTSSCCSTSALASPVLFQSAIVTNGHTGNTNDRSNYEVPSLAIQNVSGTRYAYIMGTYYYVPNGGSGTASQPYSIRQIFAGCQYATAAHGPSCLSGVTPQYVGNSVTDTTNFPVSQSWNTLASVGSPAINREPTLFFSGTTLHADVQAQDFSAYYDFTTPDPHSSPSSVTWTYSGGTWASSTDATAIAQNYLGVSGITAYFTECEISASAISGNLAVCNVVKIVGGNKVSLGIVAVNLTNIAPPTFNYTSGVPTVAAVITCSQCLNFGSGSAGYDPNFTGGIIMSGLLNPCAANAPGCATTTGFNGLFTSLYSSSLLP